MPDVVTKTTTVSYGQRVVNSLKSVVGGVVLFFLSFAVLYWNEGRVNLSKIAAKSQEVPAITSQSAGDGEFISATSNVTATTTVGDGEYLAAGPYVQVERKVEIYAWTEEQDSTTTTNSDGSESTTTTYTYKKEWTTNLEDSSAFEESAGHTNPEDFDIAAGEWRTPTVNVGEFTVNTKGLDLPVGEEIALTDAVLTPEGKQAKQGAYLFFGAGSLNAPQVGDERVSYSAVEPNFEGTIFGKRTAGEIKRYTDKDGNEIFRLFEGDRASALSTLQTEYMTILWILRIVGFLMMWIGITSVLSPLSTIIDRFPLFGSIAKAGVGIFAFTIAFPLTIITIVVSALLHSWVALLAIALMVLGYFWWSKFRATSGGMSAPAK